MESALRALSGLNWLFIVAMGGLALVRPLSMVLQSELQLPIPRIVPIAITVVITFIWVLLASILRVANPVLTLLLVGIIYGVFSLILGILVATSLGEAEDPLTGPTTILRVLGWNAIWGGVAGAAALGLRMVTDVAKTAKPRED